MNTMHDTMGRSARESAPMTTPMMASLRTGIALAVTVGVFYALCALAWVVAPGPSLSFMNNLFHGMDFTSMVRPGPLAWEGFFSSLITLCAWALAAGSFFGWLQHRLKQ